MKAQTLTSKRQSLAHKPQRPVGGAFIDSQGREIPITEGMINLACQALEKNCVGAARQA